MPTVKVTLNSNKKIMSHIFDDATGIFVASEWSRYFAKYTPMQTGTLAQSVDIKPFAVTYKQPYAHYMWEGVKYVDPLYKKGGFHNADSSKWWSRPGVTKIETNIPLVYSKEINPLAQSHWEEPAQDAFADDVARAVSQYLRRK